MNKKIDRNYLEIYSLNDLIEPIKPSNKFKIDLIDPPKPWAPSSKIKSLYSSAFGIGFLKESIFNNNDSLIVTIDQPIRLESGKLELSVPTYRTKEKNILFNSISFNLDPSGREIHSKVEYLTSYKNIGFGLTLGYKSDPYHIKFMDDFWYTSIGFNIKI